MGFKALGKGVLVGGGTLLASPVLACAGAKEEGAAGAVKGFAVGAFGGAGGLRPLDRDMGPNCCMPASFRSHEAFGLSPRSSLTVIRESQKRAQTSRTPYVPL